MAIAKPYGMCSLVLVCAMPTLPVYRIDRCPNPFNKGEPESF